MSTVTRSRLLHLRAVSRFVSDGFALIVACVLLVFVMSACGDDDDDDATSASTPPTELAGTKWVLSSAVIDDEDVATVAVAALDFGTDGTLSGTTGCNNFSGTYEQDGNELDIELGPTTLAACTDPAATAQERAILEGLPEVDSFRSAPQLELLDDNDDTLLIYDPNTAALEGTSWTATGVNNGADAVESNELTGAISAEFRSGGVITGFSGCNDYNGTYATSGTDGLTITDVAGTLKACDDATMALEGQFLAALGNTATYEMSGNTLTLRDASGAMQATFTAAA
jgi:heat shock protein HslJ